MKNYKIFYLKKKKNGAAIKILQGLVRVKKWQNLQNTHLRDPIHRSINQEFVIHSTHFFSILSESWFFPTLIPHSSHEVLLLLLLWVISAAPALKVSSCAPESVWEGSRMITMIGKELFNWLETDRLHFKITWACIDFQGGKDGLQRSDLKDDQDLSTKEKTKMLASLIFQVNKHFLSWILTN